MNTIIQRAGEIRLGGKEPARKNWNRYTAFMNEQYMPILMNSKNRFFSRSLNTGRKIMNPKPVYVQVNGNAQPVVSGQVPCMKKRNKNCISVSQWETFASRRKESANEFKKKQKESLKIKKKVQRVKNKLRNNLLMFMNNPNHVPKARITQANLKTLKNEMNANRRRILKNKPNVTESELNRILRINYIGNLINMSEKALARKAPRAPRKPRAPRLPAAPVVKRHPMNRPKLSAHNKEKKRFEKIEEIKGRLVNNLIAYKNNQNHIPKAKITKTNLKLMKKQRNYIIAGIKSYQANLMEGLTNAEKDRFIRNQLRTKATDYIQNMVNMMEKAVARKNAAKAPRAPRKPKANRVPRLPAAPVVKRHPMNRPKPVTSNGCVKQTTKKYTSRKSPPYPAAKCCGQTFPGNNGLMYVSQPDKKGTCRWIKTRV